MTRREAINFIKRSKAKYFTYGLEGSDLGTPVEKFDAIQDISSMDDFTWEGSSGQNSEVYECDQFGNLLEHVIEIQHDVKIKQEGYDIILEKGDKIEIRKDKFMRITESQQILAPYDIKVDYIQDSSISNKSSLPVGRQKGGLGRVSSKNEIIEKGSPCEIVVMSTAGQGSIAFLVMSEDFDSEIQKFVWLAYGSKKEAREDGWNI